MTIHFEQKGFEVWYCSLIHSFSWKIQQQDFLKKPFCEIIPSIVFFNLLFIETQYRIQFQVIACTLGGIEINSSIDEKGHCHYFMSV